MTPSVTCLCLTRNRRGFLARSIESFLAQDYPNRRMLIVADGEEIGDLVPREDERFEILFAPTGMKIGEKRNLGCSVVRTELIAHWDDDDISASRRLSDQIAKLVDSGKAVTGYRQMKFVFGARWYRYEGAPNFALGTSLLYRREWWESHKFTRFQIGEDSSFVGAAGAARQIFVSDATGDRRPGFNAGDLMVATIHAGNTSPKIFEGPNAPDWEYLGELS